MHVFLGFQSVKFKFFYASFKFSDFNSDVCVNSVNSLPKPTQGKRRIIVFVYFRLKSQFLGCFGLREDLWMLRTESWFSVVNLGPKKWSKGGLIIE